MGADGSLYISFAPSEQEEIEAAIAATINVFFIII
jgi:hypothetical protein